MSAPASAITPDMLSPELARLDRETAPTLPSTPDQPRRLPVASLSAAVDDLERDLIRDAMVEAAGNISETARRLGLTRRGLYLKLRRLGLEGPLAVNTK
jgi:DNA-binding NtrC family response regulator